MIQRLEAKGVHLPHRGRHLLRRLEVPALRRARAARPRRPAGRGADRRRRRASATRPTSRSGSSRRPACSGSRSGTRLGAAASRAGTSSARRWRRATWARQFDIHTGGVDHLTVHHTNEIAQSECALDVHPWVQVWMHEDFLLFDGEKMAKSTGTDLRARRPDRRRASSRSSFRFFFLQAHYRKQQAFTRRGDGAPRTAATAGCSRQTVAAARRGGRRRRGARSRPARALPRRRCTTT